MCQSLVAFWIVVFSFTSAAFAADPPAVAAPATVAGQTIQQYANDLDHENRVVRLRAVKSLGVFGASAAEPLRRALDHQDAAVRYTAAVHLGRIGGETLEASQQRLQQLADDETSFAVQMAASFALCRQGLVEEHLPLLVQGLKFPERGTACSAAELIGQLGPSAAAAVDPLQQIYDQHRPGVKGGDYHIGGAAKNALGKVRPSSP
ncbi:MAG: HEAT repeat domain-containing protein [Rubripirellula sp.]|nr:HEAT repeat domain-containing protein [Rubripirellula sp.]